MTGVSENEALLAVILVIDTYERGRSTIEAFVRQTMADRIALILVTTSADAVRTAARSVNGLHSVTGMSVDSIVPLAAPRAVGVRSVTASFVFLAETHAY